MTSHFSGRRAVFILFCLVSVFVLSACDSSETSPVQPPTANTGMPTPSSSTTSMLSVPLSCIETKMLTALKKIVPTAKFINTEWTPSKGTELADVLNNSGIACSFGIQSASIGITAMWVRDVNLFDSRINKWLEDGYEKVNISQIDEDNAYFLHKPQSATQEFNIWLLDLKIYGFWIQLGITYGDTLESGLPLIQASVDSLNFIDQPSSDRSIA